MDQLSDLNKEIKKQAKDFMLKNIEDFDGKEAGEIIGQTLKEVKTGNVDLIKEVLHEVIKEKKIKVLANSMSSNVVSSAAKAEEKQNKILTALEQTISQNSKIIEVLESLDSGIGELIAVQKETKKEKIMK